MWPSELYAQRRIELLLGIARRINRSGRRTVSLDNGSRREFGALLIATGAEPVRLPVPGAETATGALSPLVRRQPGNRRTHEAAPHASWSSAPASSGSKSRRLVADARDRRRRRRAGAAAARARHGRGGGTLRPRHCTKRRVSSFILVRRSRRIDGRTVTLSGGRHDRGGLRRDGRRRAAVHRACRAGPAWRSIAASS